ncbi:hypothetical protein Ahy_A02g008742 [Arachis hypogaea]|uniref:RHOMBOID-like protein n=1 Tax=Arachis hypogaea TaxID=3818 RepID=A0A445EFN6_ARAHY|nr:hypothetical protein Ahy_A02g008742 [Arachis hypogaea]
MAAEGGSDQFIDIVKLSPPTKFPAAFPQDLKVAPSLKRRRSGGDTVRDHPRGCLHRNGYCALKTLGRFSFQPLSENPLLGPSQSKLLWIEVILISTNRNFSFQFLIRGNGSASEEFRDRVSPNLASFHLSISSCWALPPPPQSLQIGVIYAMSAFLGALMASLFLQHTPAVASSGALYGLLGTLLSELIWNWELQIKRVSAFCLCICLQFHPCFLPYVLNFASVGGFVSGFLLGSVLLLSRKLELPKVPIKLKELSLIMVSTVKSYINKPWTDRFSGLFLLSSLARYLAVLHGININSYCTWCPYVGCIPYISWHCQNRETSCKESSILVNLT